ncbi:retrovirus-related pol polyprotein from transposon TNT 1-94 [Tanacetum coccineum]|uniref:Retrovirus-related pol polyprotein from transposon TNT 1-94 n=1 Tax=Tanacetum coccineum TaxID=301880 RepID=A0ABQ5GQW8_9ASTR
MHHAPSTSNPSIQEQEQSLIISQGVEESLKTPHFHDYPLHEDSNSQASLLNVRSSHTPLELLGKWTKNHLLVNVIGDPSRSVSTRKQLKTGVMWCYFDAFLTSVEPKNFKEAMLESSWIEAMQEEIHEFERLQVWELVPCPDFVMLIKLKWIYKVKKDELRGVLKNKNGFRKVVYVSQPEGFVDQDKPNHMYRLKKALYGLKQAPRAWYDMLSSFLPLQEFSKGLQISQSSRGIFINQSNYALEIIKKYGMLSSDPVYTPVMDKTYADADHVGCQDTRRITYGSAQFLGDKLVSWSSKKKKSTTISSTEAEYIALSGCCAQILWMRSQLTDYGFKFNKIPLYCDNKSAIALAATITEYQLVDIFTKALPREKFNFLIEKLRMKSMSPETLKRLAEEEEE